MTTGFARPANNSRNHVYLEEKKVSPKVEQFQWLNLNALLHASGKTIIQERKVHFVVLRKNIIPAQGLSLHHCNSSSSFDFFDYVICLFFGDPLSCDPVIHRVADINLRGESEDPILANKTGFMTGSISPEICKLERLSSLTIADWKGISGTIPECITSLPFLRIIDLIGNKLSGRLPAEIGRLSRLTVLNVADNALNGRIPRSIANLTDLKHLDLRNNRFSGGIPRTFGRLRMLSRALLSGNRFIGPIPNSVSYIYRLADLDLSMNRLSGPIPASLGKMPVLATLNLDGNNFSGSIPAQLLSSGISILNLSHNAIEGHIPDAFLPKSYFMVMDLSYNKLTGNIPSSIKSASYIGHLDVNHNHLCGPIPSGPPFDRLEASSFVFNDCLCGKPLRAC